MQFLFCMHCHIVVLFIATHGTDHLENFCRSCVKLYFMHFMCTHTHTRACTKAWFLDCDTLWLRSPVALIESCRSSRRLGHIFSSMSAAPGSGARGAAVEVALHWQKHYLRAPGEQLYLASPFRVPGGSPWLKDSIVQLRTGLQQKSKLEYNFFMKLAASCLQVITIGDRQTPHIQRRR